MKSRVTVAGHALHPMLITVPLGLLATSVVWDVCRLATGNATWGVVGFWTIVAGVVGGELAETLGIGVREGANPNAPSPLGQSGSGNRGGRSPSHIPIS